MNYGPLIQVVEKLLHADRKNEAESKRKLWQELAIAQDNFYKDVKSGRLISVELDAEVEPI